MEKYLPTLEDCQLIVANNSSFKCKTEEINDKIVHQFTYFLAKHNDFIDPLGDKSITAEELRGITFVEQNDGTFTRFLMLPKFFNLNQVEDTLYHNVKDYSIDTVADKLDGSMISFVKIGDTVFAKTKFSFFNEQTELANSVYNNNEHIRVLVDMCLQLNYYPIFELISPKNRIVISYPTTELRLIQIRREDGSFKNLYNGFNKSHPHIVVAEKYDHSLEDLMSLAETVEGIEGWVVQFDKMMLKVKTKWYFEKHRLMTGDINVEHKIIEMTLNETIDDVLSQLAEDATELRTFVTNISDSVSEYVEDRVNKILDCYFDAHSWYVSRENPTKKDYVDYCNMYYKEYFKEMMFMFDKGNDVELVEAYVVKDTLSRTNGLDKARKFLDAIKK